MEEINYMIKFITQAYNTILHLFLTNFLSLPFTQSLIALGRHYVIIFDSLLLLLDRNISL